MCELRILNCRISDCEFNCRCNLKSDCDNLLAPASPPYRALTTLLAPAVCLVYRAGQNKGRRGRF